jgi:hypothetical protein
MCCPRGMGSKELMERDRPSLGGGVGPPSCQKVHDAFVSVDLHASHRCV